MSSTGRSLGPGWRASGKGFQPPPAAEAPAEAPEEPRSPRSPNSTSRQRADSDDGWNEVGSGGKPKAKGSNINHFAALSLDDDAPGSSANKTANGSRSDGLRQSSFGAGGGGGGGGSGGGGNPRRSGRSLADLAKSIGPSDSAPGGRGGPVGDRRSGGPRGPGGPSRGEPRGGDRSERRALPEFVFDKSVVRYTREKLLSLRPSTSGDGELPAKLKHLEGVSVISDKTSDPVCFDTFDPDEIWAQALKERRAAANVGGIGGGGPAPGPPRGFGGGGGGNRWERGVALPPSERRGRRNDDNVNNPDELWDDPTDGPTAAASDFSAFGGSLDDVPRAGGGSSTGLGGSTGFDLSAMSEAAKKFEEELHGKDSSRVSSASNLEGGLEDGDAHTRKIGDGTEIRSGSGDDVNVFEDFGDPNADPAPTPAAATSEATGGIESGGEKSASSRLMEMIGVGGGAGGAEQPAVQQDPAPQPATSNIGGVPLNPWGEPVQQQQQQAPIQGMDIATRMAEEQRARQQQEEEEAKRRAEIERQQREAAARQQQQQQQGPSQVELILVERVCAILENSWGRSDLMSILTTLHAEDSRVIPLLGNVDALRALVARHPRRIQLAKDPSLGAEMAILLLSNAQWQQAKAQEEQQRAQQEELQRRQQLLQQQMAQEPVPRMNPNAPWFYTDPNGQVQGPFGGDEMRQWLEAGYFKADLPISQNPGARFLPLGRIFPNLEKAFQAEQAPSSPVRAPMEEPSQPAVAPAPEPKAAPVATNETSQLKAMLGLGGGGGAIASAAPEPEEEPVKKTKKKKEKTAKGAAPVVAAPPPPKEEEVPAPAPAAPAWGGAASGNPAKKKSMSEIQQEEAQVAARRAKEQPQRSGGGWAGIAASGGTTAWSGDAVKPAPRVAPAPAQAGTASQGSQPRQQSKAAVAASNKSAADDFGESGKMSPQLEAWCREQMKKISGSDDLTLVSFCMTLNDPVEIKQYLTAYLGSTPQVNNFASEFILHKDGKKAQQEKWESAGTGKKGRKKRGGK